MIRHEPLDRCHINLQIQSNYIKLIQLRKMDGDRTRAVKQHAAFSMAVLSSKSQLVRKLHRTKVATAVSPNVTLSRVVQPAKQTLCAHEEQATTASASVNVRSFRGPKRLETSRFILTGKMQGFFGGHTSFSTTR